MAPAHGAGALLRNAQEEARSDTRFGTRRTRSHLPRHRHRRAECWHGSEAPPMTGDRRDGIREVLRHLPSLNRSELRAEWRRLHGIEAPTRLGRALLVA